MFGSKSSGDKWPIKYLSEIVDPNCPISYGIVQPGDELEDGVPIVRPVDLNSNYYVYKNGLKRTTEAISNSYKRTILRGDELLLCVRGTTGVMGLATEELKGGNVTRGITPLYFKEGFNRIYLLGAFLSDDVQAYIKDNTVGSTLKGINMERVRKIQIPIPPIEIQNKWEEVFKQADKSKFMRSKSQFIEMFGNGNWEHKTLGEVGSFKRGGGFQKSDFVERGIPCIHYGQIHTRFGPFIYSHLTDISSDLESKTRFAEKGDLIIAITSEDTEGSCKSTAWLGDYPVAVGGHAAIFHHCMNPVYMSFFFKSALFNYAKREYVHGTKVCEIKPDDIAKIFVPCPPISLQEDFSAIAEQADKSKLICLLWKHCHCWDVYTK